MSLTISAPQLERQVSALAESVQPIGSLEKMVLELGVEAGQNLALAASLAGQQFDQVSPTDAPASNVPNHPSRIGDPRAEVHVPPVAEHQPTRVIAKVTGGEVRRVAK